MNLREKEKTKRRNNCLCAKCKTDIVVGDRYISVHYNDTFTRKPFGGFHPKCWEELSNGTIIKKLLNTK